MADDFKKTTIKNFLIFVTAPTLLGTFGLYVAAYMVLIWASASIDSTEAAREAHRTEHIISELRTGIAREQESVTIWGDAVKMLHMPDGEERSAWLDANLGGWMHSYFGHDAAYILSPTNTPIFASFKGERQAPAAYKLVETSAQPLVNKLRKALLSGDEGGVSDGMRSPGASDFVRVDGHPAAAPRPKRVFVALFDSVPAGPERTKALGSSMIPGPSDACPAKSTRFTSACAASDRSRRQQRSVAHQARPRALPRPAYK